MDLSLLQRMQRIASRRPRLQTKCRSQSASSTLTEVGGGVPLTREGQVVAGVGVSGGTVEQDVAIVEAALR
jgi:uncharacterized protein GlcG (DUF336 family)